MSVRFRLSPFSNFKMPLDQNTLDELAAVLYAYEDPDSFIHGCTEAEDIDDYEESLQISRKNYGGLLDERRSGLRGAVEWLAYQQRDDLPSLIPELYRQIWQDWSDDTQDIINSGELDETRYVAGMNAVFSRIDRL